MSEYERYELKFEPSSQYWMGKSTTTDPQKILKNPCYKEIHFFKEGIGRKFNKLHTHPFYGDWTTPHYYTFFFLIKFKRKRKHFGIRHFKRKPAWFATKIKTNYLHSNPKKICRSGFEYILSDQRDKQKIHFIRANV